MTPIAVPTTAVGAVPPPRTVTDPDVLAGFAEDASGAAPGRPAGVVRATDEAEIASYLRATVADAVPVLPQAARTSLTGGAIPHGTVVLSVEEFTAIGAPRASGRNATVEVGAGVRLADLQAELRRRGWYYPPVPTYQEAMVGGVVSTNAGGAATFKYGVTRRWVRALRVVLADGEILDIERGQYVARRGESFVLRPSEGSSRTVPVPAYDLPPLAKISAGYHASDPLDLVDLVVGSEGTLGLITAATLDLVPLPSAVLTGMAFLPDERRLVPAGAALRSLARRARGGGDGNLPDVRAIESLDARCLALLRGHGDAGRLRVPAPHAAAAAVVFEVELPSPACLDDTLGSAPVGALISALSEHGAEDVRIALPGDDRQRQAILDLREAVPRRVNELLAERRRSDPAVRKVGGDLIVPFEHLDEMVERYRAGFEARGLEYAVWGHLSDGNLHPNAIPRDEREVGLGEQALHEFAGVAVRLGGSPLSEHGVGRSPLKQAMLRGFLGAAAIESMRSVKRGFDPAWRFAPGVLFPKPL